MPTAPGSLRYLGYGFLGFSVLSLGTGCIIDRIPNGDLRGAIGLPLILLTFGVLLYAMRQGEQHTWKVLKLRAEGIPVFYSFGRNDVMLMGNSKGWIGYGDLKASESGSFEIESKYQLKLDHLGGKVNFGAVVIENRNQRVACISSQDGTQLFLWQPGSDIRLFLEPFLTQKASSPEIIGIPDIDRWLVLEPARLTKKGLWPTLVVVGLLQIAVVSLARVAELPQVAWIPVGLCVAPMVYLLFETAKRPQPISFGELLERQIIAEDTESLS